jgi:hypothetical protein
MFCQLIRRPRVGLAAATAAAPEISSGQLAPVFAGSAVTLKSFFSAFIFDAENFAHI